MLSASQKVKDAIYAPSRRIVAKVTFGITDVTAYGDVESIVGETVSYCNINQVVNRVREPSYKLATYEDKMFSLDGTVTFADENPSINGETGFVSSKLCDDLGRFVVPGRGVLLDGNKPILNTIFSFYNTTTNIWYDCISDANGEFTFNVPDGVYKIEGVWLDSTKFWYTTAAKTFSISGGLESGKAELEVNIKGYSKPVQGPVTLTVEFNGIHSSAGITVTFDSLLGEYAVDYNVEAYNAAGELIIRERYTNNTEIIHQAIGQLFGYKKLVITIKKWSKPYRRARIMEVDFGIVKIYTDNLVRMSLVEDLDLTSGQIPSAEFKFEVDNSGREFNILNPSGFYKYLQERQSIYATLGVELEDGSVSNIPLGEYFLAEWTSNEGALTATFTARTILDLMASYPYENLSEREISLKQLTEEIFSVCKVTSYEIDSTLESITTKGLVKRTDCRTVLQMIAIAGCANVFVTRTGVIKLVKADAIGDVQDSITFDNVYSEPQVLLEKIVKTVEVSYFDDLEQSTIVAVAVPGISEGDTLSLSENTLIDSPERAMAVAKWILAQKNGRRAKYTMDFRGNPLHELADVVEIENSYGTNKKAILTKIDMSYEGYLQAKTEAKGAAE